MANTAVTICVLKTFMVLLYRVVLSTELDTSTCVPHAYAFSKGRLETPPLTSVTSVSVAKCMAACLESEECVSINFCRISTGITTCELLGKTVCNETNAAQINVTADWKHYVIGCLENVMANKKVGEYRACYQLGFCNDSCAQWSLAGRRKKSDTVPTTTTTTIQTTPLSPPSTSPPTVTSVPTTTTMAATTTTTTPPTMTSDRKGTTFVTAFMRNGGTGTEFFGFYINSCSANSVTYNVTAPRHTKGILASGVIGPYQTVTVAVPPDLETSTGAKIEDKGLLIETSDEVTVFGYNAKQFSTDTFTVMPLESLGMRYYLVTWQPASYLLVATVNDTVVQIDLRQSDALFTYNGGQYKQSVLTLNLQAYNTLHVDIYERTDFSGTCIESDKPLVVLAGSSEIAYDSIGTDLITDQIAPTSTWGNEYVLVNAVHTGMKAIFKIIGDDGAVSIVLHTENGQQQFSISGTGSTVAIMLNDTCAYLVADKPVGVAMLTENFNIFAVDNAFMMVPSVSMWPYLPIVFSTPAMGYSAYNPDQLMLVIPADAVGKLRLDNVALPSQWVSVPGLSSHVAASFSITDGNHVLSSAHGNFPVSAAIYRDYHYTSYLLSLG